MKSVPKHAKDKNRGTIALSDFKPSNMHPKAKFRISMALLGTFLIIFGCIYMLSTATINFNFDMSTQAGLSYFFKDLVALGYIIGTILVIIILWYCMIKDCPLSPAAKANYEMSHDKSLKGVKVVAALASAVASKGSGSSIDNVATALDNYFEEGQEAPQRIQQQQAQSVNPKTQR